MYVTRTRRGSWEVCGEEGEGEYDVIVISKTKRNSSKKRRVLLSGLLSIKASLCRQQLSLAPQKIFFLN